MLAHGILKARESREVPKRRNDNILYFVALHGFEHGVESGFCAPHAFGEYLI